MTENCRSLRYFLEKLVEKGHLKEFIDDEELEDPADRSGDQFVVTGIINTIASVSNPSVVSNRAIKAWVNRAEKVEHAYEFDQDKNDPTYTPVGKGEVVKLTFSDADLIGVDFPHNDLLVIRVNIDTWGVRRILINPGVYRDHVPAFPVRDEAN